MRGDDASQGALFSYVQLDDRVPEDHPLRPIREMVNGVLKTLSPEFDKLYSKVGRPSIPPEKLLRALLLQMLYTIRSERQLMEQLDYNLLYRWFVGLGVDDVVWVPTVFSKNRDRLLEGDISDLFFDEVIALAEEQKLVSGEHFTVDGTLIEAWAGIKSFKKKDDESDDPPGGAGRNPDVNFHGEKRSNETHESTTDPDARLAKKGAGKEAKLSFAAHITTENRNGLVVAACVTTAHGRAEREAALQMLAVLPREERSTVGADKGYDYEAFTVHARSMGVTPHVAQRKQSSIDGRTTRHSGYEVSQRFRKRVEEVFGWIKTVAVLRKTRHRGRDRVDWVFRLAAAAYNLVRIRNLMAEAKAQCTDSRFNRLLLKRLQAGPCSFQRIECFRWPSFTWARSLFLPKPDAISAAC